MNQGLGGYDRLSKRLIDFLSDYRDPHNGVSIGIFPDVRKERYASKMNLLNPEHHEMREELWRCLGLSPDADFDMFAATYGGLTKKEILNRLSP